VLLVESMGRSPHLTATQLAAVPIQHHQWHGGWNYSILAQAA